MPPGLPRPGQSLADLFPDQAAQWHPTLNGNLDPTVVSGRSNRKVWWLCTCGMVWEAVINNRTTKMSPGCRECSRKLSAESRSRPEPGRSLTDLFPAIAGELHPTRNAGKAGTDIRPSLHKKVWWLCPLCGHEYAMEPRRRTAAPFSGCPPCSYRRAGANARVPQPGRSLAEVEPEIAATWHPEKNAMSASSVSANSGQRVWWLCPDAGCEHEWQTAVANRTSGKRTGCPKCSAARRHQPAAGESLADLYPELAKEWHPTRNGSLSPDAVMPGSSTFSVWWLCPDCSHEWEATPNSRSRAGTGCSPCSYRKRMARRDTPRPGQSLADRFPELLLEWDSDRNDDLDPQQLKPGSDLKVWWTCQRRGHSWRTHIYQRTGSLRTGCPECVHMPGPGESFADLNPAAALEWHPTRNGDHRPDQFKPSSVYRAWWKCRARGHVWQADVGKRNGPSASACPKCTMWGTSATQIRLAHELAATGIAVDFDYPRIPVAGRRPVAADIVIPTAQIIIEYDGSQYHQTPLGAERDRRQSQALTNAGWIVLRVRPAPLERLDDLDIMLKNSPTVKDIAVTTLTKLRELGHPAPHHEKYLADPELWATAAADEATLNHRSRSLAVEFPDIAAEWHPTKNNGRTPDSTTPGSKIDAWWLCRECGHEWRARPGRRTTEGKGCPQCARAESGARRRTAAPGESMADLYPHVLRIFDKARNPGVDLYQLNPGATLKIWWLCPDCGREWSTVTGRNTGCRACSAKRRGATQSTPNPGETLAELHPEIAKEWHPTRNGNLVPSAVKANSSKKVWWLCGPCGREWQRSPGLRVKEGSGCRGCAAKVAGAKRKTPGPGESLAELHPDLVSQWIVDKNGALTPDTVRPGSPEQVWWRCSECGNEWRARIWARARKGHGCKKCASRQLSRTKRTPKPGHTLADVKPELLALWHPTRNAGTSPADLTPNSHTRVWWKCRTCGNEWQATPGRPSCRPCSMAATGRRRSLTVTPGSSLAERFPSIAAQWHPTRNGDQTPDRISFGTNTDYWWRCTDCGHEWIAKPSNRKNQVYLCPRCRTTKVRDR